MNRIEITTPARLHFGLIDMNGELGRVDGGVGLALEDPHTLIEATRADEISVQCAQEPEILERLEAAVTAVCRAHNLPGVHLNVRERPLPHMGLGSATQSLVGAALAVSRLYDLDVPTRDLAEAVGRGGTSGIGVQAIQTGGFIVDGGHRFRREGAVKHEFAPSAASTTAGPPPVLARHDFPDWDILIVAPMGEGASGLREVTLFKVVCPLPLEQVQRMCHIIMMQMLPAILERDLDQFGLAMQGYQQCGFKVFELRAQTQLLHDALQFLRDNGGIGVGMSSWGPSVFAFGEDLTELKGKAEDWLTANGGGEAILTKANNQGMRVVSS